MLYQSKNPVIGWSWPNFICLFRTKFFFCDISHTKVCDFWYTTSQHHQTLEEVYLVEDQEIDIDRNNKHVKPGLSPEGIISYCDAAPRPQPGSRMSIVTSRDQLRTNH